MSVRHEEGAGTATGQEPAEGAGPTTQPATGCGQELATNYGQEPDAGTDPTTQPVTGCGQEPGAGAQPRPLDDLEMGAWRAFLTASATVSARLDNELEAQAGISMREYEILVRLSEAPGRRLRMSALADVVSYSRSRLTHTVGRLENSGYVQRVSCGSDGRGVYCTLTQKGRRFLTRTASVHLDGVRRHVLDRLSREQLVQMREVLETLAAQEGPSAQETTS